MHHLDLSEVSFKNVSLDCESLVCLKNTNAEFLYEGETIRNCDLSFSKIEVDFGVTKRVINSSLYGVDLSDDEMQLVEFMCTFSEVILSDTGIHIVCNSFSRSGL